MAQPAPHRSARSSRKADAMTARRTPAPLRAIAWLFKALFLTVRAAFAAALGAAVLVGLPVALVRFAGWPLPHRMLSLGQLKTDLTSPILGDQFYLNAIAIVLWFLWSILVFSFALELVYAARRIPAPHVPGLGPMQLLAGFLITAIGVTALLGRTAAPARAATATVAAQARPAATALPVAGVERTTATATSGTGAAARESVHHVKSGDTLFSIAKTDLGDGEDWRALYQANAGVVQADGRTLTDADLILPGWDITIPGTETALPSTSPVPADIPATPSPVATGHAAPPVTAPSSSAGPRTHALFPAAPTVAAPVTPASGTGPAPTAAVSPRPSPANPHSTAPAPAPHAAATGDHQVERAARRHGGVAVSLPDGGTIGITLAVALGSALVLAGRWRNRRRDVLHPSAVPELTGVLRAARRANLALTAAPPTDDRSAPDEADDIYGDEDLFAERLLAAPGGVNHDCDGEATDYFACEPEAETTAADGGTDTVSWSGLGTRFTAPMAPGSIAVAERDGAEIPLLPTGPGLGLLGPGAKGAARAIAASVLSAGAPDRTGDLARLIIPAADLATLLDVEELGLPAITAGIPELVVTADLAAALAEAEVHALLRTRLLQEYDADDLDALAGEEDCPPLVLMAAPTRPLNARIKALADTATPLRITPVLLGAHPSGATVLVEADGTATGPAAGPWEGTRLWNLTPAALTEIAALLALAAGHDPGPSTTAEDEPDQWPDLGPLAPLPHPDGENSTQGTVTVLPLRTRPQDADSSPGTPTSADAADASDIASVTVLPLRPAPPAPATTGRTGTARASAALAAWEQNPIRITVLGGLQITAAGQPVAGLRTPARVLAALLAVKGSAGATAAQIDAMCWPDASPAELDRVAKWRSDGLTSLRTRLNAAAGRRGTAYVALDRATGRYRLNPDLVATDAGTLQAVTAAARDADTPAERLALLSAASPLCTGKLLDGELGEVFDWGADFTTDFADLQTSMLGRLAALAAAAGRTDQALGALEQAAALTEDNEDLYRQMFDILAADGRHAEVPGKLKTLEAFADSMGAEVTPETRRAAADAMRQRHG